MGIGQTSISCDGACEAVGQPQQGLGLRTADRMTVVNCQCGQLPKVNITCLDWPFTACCQGEFKCDMPPVVAPKWTCPAGGGCPGGNCAGDYQWQEWVAAHNVYRCMHDAPPVAWGHYVFAAVYDH